VPCASVSLRSPAVALAALFAVLAVLVAAGACTHLDQWAVDHLMPGARFTTTTTPLTADLVPLRHVRWHDPWQAAVNIVALPASFVLALALVAWRSRRLALALVACVLVEVVCKEVLDRPALYSDGRHIAAFDSSFPSGHTLRIVLLALAFRPLVGRWAAVWAVAAIALVVLAGWHTPTDVAGGVVLGLLGGVAAAGGRAAGALRARRLGRPSRA
jgi:membrane-associated phospholipid phosphatase